MVSDRIKLEASWKSILKDEFSKEYMERLRDFLVKEKRSRKIIFPSGSEYFNAFNLTPFDKVKVVILGQDPYHRLHQAHGLCFSVKPGIQPPPSLINVFNEVKNDLNIDPATHGCLISWAQQGVLLLNSVLTVEQGKAGSHQGKGWEQFTDVVIDYLNNNKKHLVFLLWGSYAQDKGKLIDQDKHLVLKAPHPSPLSAYRGFLGCQHFSATNHYLCKHGLHPIEWQLPSIEQVESILGQQHEDNVCSA